jgi:hypothetical protein
MGGMKSIAEPIAGLQRAENYQAKITGLIDFAIWRDEHHSDSHNKDRILPIMVMLHTMQSFPCGTIRA